MDFDGFFCTATGSGQSPPYAYQRHLATGPTAGSTGGRPCESALINIPTGYGKTAAVTLAWLWNRVQSQRGDWPRRLVYCLPMRVLVEQTHEVIRTYLANLGLTDRVGLHLLMGGIEAEDWHLKPEQDAILLGTQDMLLSRALNRGYSAFRARWPVDFGLLHHDCLWVFDEVQLFDVGLATSVQLHAFRQEDRARTLRPCHCWWMSATLQPGWFRTVDFAPHLGALESGTVLLPDADRSGALWEATKPCRLESLPEADNKDCKKWAQLVFDQHRDSQPTPWGRITLVIANTVKRAALLHDALAKLISKHKSAVDLRLVHSRFRGAERRQWREDFLNKEACREGVERIIVSTQIVEAGVDLTASCLVTELAPWPSLIQRFGRAARYGGTAPIIVVDRALTGKASLPYGENELAAAREALAGLENASLAGLAALDEGLRANAPDLYGRLFPYDPAHLLTRRELDELFDTTPDLTGADLDISRFIRAGEERDLSVFWRAISDGSALDADLQPARDELCPVPIADARKWLCQDNSERLHEGCRAWVWDYTEDEWRACRRADLFPGRTVLVEEKWGGYDPVRGFTGQKPGRSDARSFALSPSVEVTPEEKSNAAQERDDLSHLKLYKTIHTHSNEVAAKVRDLSNEIGLSASLAEIFDLAARLHDWGKAHRIFQGAIKDKGGYDDRTDLAKAPKKAWRRGYERRGFRHELASTLAVLELLRRANPWHAGLLGPHREVLAEIKETPPPADDDPVAGEISARLRSLDADALNLLLYLICTHHGKVRGAWHAAPLDQEWATKSGDGRMPLRGVCEGDVTLAVRLPLDGDSALDLPAVMLHLDAAVLGLSARYGASWSERVLGLLEKHSPFTLAYFEALFRCADVRASKLTTLDPLLSNPST